MCMVSMRVEKVGLRFTEEDNTGLLGLLNKQEHS